MSSDEGKEIRVKSVEGEKEECRSAYAKAMVDRVTK
jgi:hypothetical protein